MASALDHLEKTFSELYRKEIDQEENVWRTLPFFAAAIALQFGVISGLLPKMGTASPGLTKDFVVTLLLIVTLDAATLILLSLSIASRRYEYLPDEPELLRFARKLDATEATADAIAPGRQFDAAAEFRMAMATAYAAATSHNRRINQNGVTMRKFAGLFILASMMFTLFLFTRLMLSFTA